MIKLAIITSTRAEYGLLSPIIHLFKEYENDNFKVEVIVTGTHLSENHGYTIREIERDNVRIDEKIYIPVDSKNELNISENMAETLVKFTKLFFEKKYTAIMILGDRYEMLSIAISSINCNIPIIHLCGGDTTEGAIDEYVRHSISKMSYLHFTTNEISKKRVIQLGEDPKRVYNVGSTSVDNINKTPLLSKENVLKSIELKLCDYALGTFHPTTLGKRNIEMQMMDFLDALKEYPQINFIITKANADLGGSIINDILEVESKKKNNIYVYESLGMVKYLSLMKHALFVIGNSSSGIVETPILKKPSINIGDRQKGRLQCENVINIDSNKKQIIEAIELACSNIFQEKCEEVQSPFGKGNASESIVRISLSYLESDMDLKKKFYDLEVNL